MTLRARPAAKVNLTLAVGERGEDGYHPLRSVFLRIGLADELMVDLATGAAADELVVSGPIACPVEGNLVLRAFQLLRGAVGQPLPPLRARLIKRIPLAAGLAGGSSDGAAALELARRAWGVGLAHGVARALEAELGSDVPFFARGGPVALVEGRGERVTPLGSLTRPVGVVLAFTAEELSTRTVYSRFDELILPEPTSGRATDELVELLSTGPDGAAMAALAERLAAANDLWPAAVELVPALADRRSLLERLSARRWLMTGSGPTLFALYPSAEQAAADRDRLAADPSVAQLGLTLVATEGGAGPTEEESR